MRTRCGESGLTYEELDPKQKIAILLPAQIIPSCIPTLHSEMREKHPRTQPIFVLSQCGECLTQHLDQLLQGWKDQTNMRWYL